MSVFDILKGMSGSEVESAFEGVDNALDEHFGQHGQRRRFMEACNKLSYNDLNITQTLLLDTVHSQDCESLVENIENPSRVAYAILTLTEELKTTTNTTIFMSLLKIVQRENVITALNRVRFLFWEEDLFENNDFPKEFIEFLWNANKNKRYKHRDYVELVRTISKHKNSPVAVLNDLFNVDDLSVRIAVAKHPNIDDVLINVYLNSKRMSDREQIAKSKYICKEALLSLMNDKHAKVSDMARKQFKKRYPKERITKKAIQNAVNIRIDRPYIKPDKPQRKFDAFHDARMGIEHVMSLSPTQRASIIKSGSLRKENADVIEALINDKNTTVRREIAAHRLCPEKTLKQFLNDTDFVIVTNAITEYIRREPNTVFEDVVDNKEVDFSYELLNTYINEKGFIRPGDKLGIQTASEVKRVMLVARYTSNSLIQMRIVNDLDDISYLRLKWYLLENLRCNSNLSEAVVRKIAVVLSIDS